MKLYKYFTNSFPDQSKIPGKGKGYKKRRSQVIVEHTEMYSFILNMDFQELQEEEIRNFDHSLLFNIELSAHFPTGFRVRNVYRYMNLYL